MRKLNLEFSADGGYARRTGYVVLLLGLISLGSVLYHFKAAMDEAAYWDLRITNMDMGAGPQETGAVGGASETGTGEALPSRVSSVLEGGKSRQEVIPEIKKANAVMSELDLPWESLFNSVEHAASKDVALLSFQPNAVGRTMRIGGEAKNIPAMLDFVGALEREPAFQDAHLLKYEIKRDDPQRPVVFSLTASWI
jgi:hypothetical protein